jgi:hypothetical protein
MTSNIPEGYRVLTDKDNRPLFVAQKTGPLQQLQGVVRNRTLLQGQQLPGMGQMQGQQLSGMGQMQGQQLPGMGQMQGTGPSGMLQGQQMGSMMQMQG